MGVTVSCQALLEKLVPVAEESAGGAALAPSVDGDLDILSADSELAILLVDVSGSASADLRHMHDLIQGIVQKGTSLGKRVAVYGFNGGPSELDILEYKAADSPSLRGLEAIFQTAGNGSPLRDALDWVGQEFNPAAGGTLLLYTDGGFMGDAHAISERITDLRRAGMKVTGLLSLDDSVTGDQIFGRDNYLFADRARLTEPTRKAEITDESGYEV